MAQYLTKGYLYYTVDELLEEALQLQHDFPECSNTWMLMGLVCEISKVHKLDAVEAFKMLLEIVHMFQVYYIDWARVVRE